MKNATTGLLRISAEATVYDGSEGEQTCKNQRVMKDDPDKTEPHRLRSLRAIIYDAGKGSGAKKAETHRVTQAVADTRNAPSPSAEASSPGSFMNVLLDELFPKREPNEDHFLAPEEKTKAIADCAHPDLTFTKLAPIATPLFSRDNAETPALIEEISTWLESFKSQLNAKLGQGQEAALETYVDLLMHVHPELLTLVKHPTASHTPQRIMKRKTPARSRSNQDEMSEWHCFYQGMEQWIQRLEICISEEPAAHQSLLWERARLSFLHKALVDVLSSLEESLKDAAAFRVTLESFTGGVSFVKRSESHQFHVTDEYAPLPPVVIQPPNWKRVQTPRIAAMIQQIISDEVLLVRMPDRDDALIKTYLLEKSERHSIVRTTNGSVCQILKGLENLNKWIGDHVFICCHYYFDKTDGSLKPCLDAKKGKPFGLEESNVQLVMVVRKGIGGTWALRNAARSLDDAHILSLITGQKSLKDLDFEAGTGRMVVGRPKRKTRSLSTGRFYSPKAAEKRSEVVRSVSVMPGYEQRRKLQKTPVISTSSLNDWFVSVQSTAAQIMDAATQKGGAVASQLTTESGLSCSLLKEKSSVEKSKKATTVFMQQTLKRRLPSCNSTTPANVKIHTLSCRLEMFVGEDLWKSLDRSKSTLLCMSGGLVFLSRTDQITLHSVLMGVEEWLQGKIQFWNAERLSEYSHDALAIVEEKIEEMERKAPVPQDGTSDAAKTQQQSDLAVNCSPPSPLFSEEEALFRQLCSRQSGKLFGRGRRIVGGAGGCSSVAS